MQESLSPSSKSQLVSLRVMYNNAGCKEPSERECAKHFFDPKGTVKLPMPPGQEHY